MPAPPNLDPTVRFVQEKDLVTRCIAGETVIVPIRQKAGDLDSIFTLNEVGTFIWQCIDGKTAVGEIVDAVCREFEVSRTAAEEDVNTYLADLLEAGLITPLE